MTWSQLYPTSFAQSDLYLTSHVTFGFTSLSAPTPEGDRFPRGGERQFFSSWQRGKRWLLVQLQRCSLHPCYLLHLALTLFEALVGMEVVTGKIQLSIPFCKYFPPSYALLNLLLLLLSPIDMQNRRKLSKKRFATVAGRKLPDLTTLSLSLTGRGTPPGFGHTGDLG